MEKETKKIIVMYMKALGKEKLSLKCWDRIAKLNSKLLKKYE